MRRPTQNNLTFIPVTGTAITITHRNTKEKDFTLKTRHSKAALKKSKIQANLSSLPLAFTHERKEKFCIRCHARTPDCNICEQWQTKASLVDDTLVSLRNHYGDGDYDSTNLQVTLRKTIVLHFLYVHFSSLHSSKPFLSFSTTWNDMFCCCVDDVSPWRHIFNLVLSALKRWFQSNSMILERVLQAWWLGVIEKLLEKSEVVFSEGDLVVIDVVPMSPLRERI